MALSTLKHPKAVMSALKRDFEMTDEREIQAFLERNPDVPQLLLEIRSVIRDYFGDDAVRLDVFYDPEWEEAEPELFANIRTRRDGQEALTLLKAFDRAWWLKKLAETRAPVVVSIHLI